MTDCTFTHIERHGQQLSAYPLCGHESELWELVDDHGVFKFACCGRSEDGGLGLVDGCPLNHPPRRHFYMPTLREAARKWNDFAQAATAARNAYTQGPAPQQVLKAEAATPDATDRGEPASLRPSVGSMGAGQPADAGPAGGLMPAAMAIASSVNYMPSQLVPIEAAVRGMHLFAAGGFFAVAGVRRSAERVELRLARVGPGAFENGNLRLSGSYGVLVSFVNSVRIDGVLYA